jgi:hypothetical protein
MRVNYFILIVLFVILISGSVSALTGSIGNARMILYPKVGILGTEIEKSILVKNVNDIPVDIELKPSESFEKIVEIIDEKFTLEPKEEMRARFLIKLTKPGDYEGKITVFFTPLDGKTGVALSSTIIIHAERQGFFEESEEEINEDNEEVIERDGIRGEGEIKREGESSKNLAVVILGLSTVLLLAIFLVLICKVKINKKKRSDRSS